MTENITTLISTDTTLSNNTASTLSTEVDYRGCVGGMVQIAFQYSTAPTADKTIDVYLLPATASGGDYDVYSQGRNIFLGSVKVANVTTLQRISYFFQPVLCPYAKIALHNNATGQTVTLKNVTVVVRKVA
jgi:hypothetical protein